MKPLGWALLLPSMLASADEPVAAPARPPASATMTPAAPTTAAHSTGSLYSEASFQPLTADRRRFEVGDLITLLVSESTSASSSADTGTNRDASVGMGVNLPGWNKSAAINGSNDFTGTGRTQRAGRVLAQITVTVREVMPNGDLRVAGEQWLEINGEKQTIRAEGRVRPRDVSEANTVPSNRLGEARLAFSGDGVLADLQRPRWWQKFLSLFGL